MRKRIAVSPENDSLAEVTIVSSAVDQLFGVAFGGKSVKELLILLFDAGDLANNLGLDKRKISASKEGIEKIRGLAKSKEKKYLAISHLKKVKDMTDRKTKPRGQKQKASLHEHTK